jgi:hypothetical protein
MKLLHRIAGLAFLGAMGASGVLQAQKVDFKGSTGGCFYISGSCTASTSASEYFLQFTGGTFDATTTSSGILGIGSAPNSPNNFGSFSLGASPAEYDGTNFLLKILFDLPTVTSSNTVYEAAVLGSVDVGGDGGIYIHFADSPQVFTFNGPTYGGQFSLALNDISVTPGTLEANTPVAVSGFIRTTVTPEPATVGLFALGLLGLVPMARLRRRNDA